MFASFSSSVFTNALFSSLSKNRKALLRHFKTVTAVSEADLAELEGAPGMTKPAARRVWEHFHPPEGPQTPPKVGEEGSNPGEIAPNS